MDRNFALLGLREDATKDEIKEAYESRLQKYHSSDYDDDPEYLRQKLAELKSAYEQAMKAAADGGGDTSERKTRRVSHEEQQKQVQRPGKKSKAKEGRSAAWVNSANRVFSASGRSGNRPKITAGIVITVIVLIVSISGAFLQLLGDDSYDYDENYDYYEGEEYYDITYDETDYTAENRTVLREGQEVSRLFSEAQLDYDMEWEFVEDDFSSLQRAADTFASLYTGQDTIGALSRSLYSSVAPFPADETDDLEYQIGAVLAYYGFPDLYEISGYIDPYTSRTMVNWTGYLEFLAAYYRNHIADSGSAAY